MIQIVLLEHCQNGKSHFYPILAKQYVTNLNSRDNHIIENTHEFIPNIGDELNLKLSCNGDAGEAVLYSVDKYMGQKNILDEDILPRGTRAKIGMRTFSIDNVYHCKISEIIGGAETPDKTSPVTISCHHCS